MHPALRQAWTSVIQADDYDRHMAAVGQAEANAGMIRKMLREATLPAGASVLVAGAGTGQMFDYITPESLGNLSLTFTDIREAFLSRLIARLERLKYPRFRAMVDDVERTHLGRGFAAIALVLVLEHVEWQRALEQMTALDPARLLIIIQVQENPGPVRPLVGSLSILADTARPALVPPDTLISWLDERGYSLARRYRRTVLDGKIMHGLVFHHKPNRRRLMNETAQQYTQRILGYTEGQDSLKVQQGTAKKLAALIRRKTKKQLTRRPAPGKWSIAEILAHLADTEIVVGWRLRQILSTNGTPIQAYDQNTWAAAFDYAHRDAKRSLEVFRFLRDVNVALLKSVPKQLWDNYGMHQERGKETVAHVVRMIAGHDLNHLRQVEGLAKGA
jgi:uncharacterized damage-inducible protein DinB